MDPTATPTSRRRLLQSSAALGLSMPFVGSSAAATGSSTPPALKPQQAKQPNANGVVQIAQVGVGGRGNGVREGIVSHDSIKMVGLCDIDENSLNATKEQHPDGAAYIDWRAMLADLDDQIDAVAISCPDHMHAPVAVTAMRMGKHVYVEKPLTHTIKEARLMLDLARETGVVCQMGNQAHSSAKHTIVKQQLRDGVLGKVQRIHAWSNRPIWPQGEGRPEGSDPVPNHVHWYNWLGVAADRPYVEGKYHGFSWRGYWDFGTGALGDMGCHIMDLPIDALLLNRCLKVTCRPSSAADYMHPAQETIEMTFAGTEYTDGDVPYIWYDGGRRPSTQTEPLLSVLRGKIRLSDNGRIIVGERGIAVEEHYGPVQWFDLDGEPMEVPAVEADDVHHQRSWIDAIRGQQGANLSNFEAAVPLTEACLVGTIAARFPEQELLWDADRMIFTNSEEATSYVHKTYRQGWEVEGL